MSFRAYYWALLARFYSKFGPMKCAGRIRIVGLPVVKGDGEITVGARSDFRSKSWSTAMGVIQPCTFNVLLHTSRIEIGEDCGFSGAVVCAKDKVVIGNRVQLGSGAVICDTDFHSTDAKIRGTDADLESAASAPVTIGDDCFIGARSMILKGVQVGARAIVGAGAVVAKNVPAGAIVAGNPAKVIGSVDG